MKKMFKEKETPLVPITEEKEIKVLRAEDIPDSLDRFKKSLLKHQGMIQRLANK